MAEANVSNLVCEIHLVSEEDAVTLGAALLGAVACGAFASMREAAATLALAATN